MLYGLRNRRGETLIETLVSLTIAAISLLMFASTLAHTRNVAQTGQRWNNEINERSVYLETKPDEKETEEMTEAGVASPTGTISIEDGKNKLIDSEPVTFYVAHYGEEDDEKNVVVSYRSTS